MHDPNFLTFVTVDTFVTLHAFLSSKKVAQIRENELMLRVLLATSLSSAETYERKHLQTYSLMLLYT